ncbi:MAG TPA: hypothetical protein PLE81_08455, partial [Brevundimonas sp.]|nr:hypothetical protein [Brevundimonas sp.]
MSWLKISLVSVLSLATATSGALAQSASPAPVGPTRALDGEATPAACEPFGYRLQDRHTDGRTAAPMVATAPGTTYGGPPPPPAPPPPPPPP